MSNRELFSFSAAAETVGGELAGAKSGVFHSVSIDSRTCGQGSLFVPLPGERTDGHRYIGGAFNKGAVCSFVEEAFYSRNRNALLPLLEAGGLALIVVGNTLSSLQKLAQDYLSRRQNVITIGVTGSNGKTTTKEFIGAGLRGKGAVMVSQGNFNSDIGVSLSAFQVTDEHSFAVFEMGMNRPGEMREIAGIVKPFAALVANIGTAHIGILGSKDNIAREKKEIFSFFSGRETAFIYENEPYFSYLSEGVRGKVVPYGPGHTDGFVGIEERGLSGTGLQFENGSITLRLAGEHNALNALGALTLCRSLGAEFEDVKKGFESVQPLSGRGEVIEGPVTVIKDCYNANPESLKRALSLMESLAWYGRKIAVIGAMKELGERSGDLHRLAAGFLLDAHLDSVLLYGTEVRAAWEIMEEERPGLAFWTDDFAALKHRVSIEAKPGSLVLLKGSRATELERLMEVLCEQKQG